MGLSLVSARVGVRRGGRPRRASAVASDAAAVDAAAVDDDAVDAAVVDDDNDDGSRGRSPRRYTSVRKTLEDPNCADWYVPFKPEGPWYSSKCDNNFDPPKCSNLYHNQVCFARRRPRSLRNRLRSASRLPVPARRSNRRATPRATATALGRATAAASPAASTSSITAPRPSARA